MCKLFAYVNHETAVVPSAVGLSVNKVLQHLFYINSYGQQDGSGIMWTDKQGDTEYLKDAVPSPTLMRFKDYTDIKASLYQKKFVAGHTRYSTVGGNSWENSHPFHYGDYIGMQNGTARGAHSNLVKGEISPCNVDSASVIWSINQQGVEKTFENYNGEGVFLFTNLKDNSFNIVKNEYRNLHVAKVKGYKLYIFCTDKYALALAIDRANLSTEEIAEVPDDMLLTYTFDNKMEATPLEVPCIITSSYGNYNSMYDYWDRWKEWDDTDDMVYDYNTGTYVPRKDKPETITYLQDKTKESLSTADTYVCDCDWCASPLHSNSAVYGNSTSYAGATIVVCSGCIEEAKSYTTGAIYKINDFSEKEA